MTNTDEKPEYTKPDALSLFLAMHADRVAIWMKDHPNTHDKLPIVKTGESSYRWLNRAERRKK
jgi:hypothetical protein